MKDFDVIVIGAGPGGATAAAVSAKSGHNVLLVDKSSFPRDKVCGDAISGKSISILSELGLIDRMKATEQEEVWGVTLTGPKGEEVKIPFTQDFSREIPPGFVCTREVYDKLLVDYALEQGVTFWEDTTVLRLLREGDRVTGVQLKDRDHDVKEVTAPVVIGADGAYSVVAREVGVTQMDEKHYVAALRAYYRGVTGFDERGFIELHLVEEAIPGYFWIFELPDGMANVGVGMLSAAIKKRDVRLKKLLEAVVKHPRFQERFKDAERVGTVKGWGLPLGSKPRPMAGDGWMLVGDAASLIDPFTGEGIGNAMVSGHRAAQWAAKAQAANDYSEVFLKGYEKEVLGLLKRELRISYLVQRMGSWQWLTNFVIRKAARSKFIADTISCMFDELDGQHGKVMSTPSFYFKTITSLLLPGRRAAA